MKTMWTHPSQTAAQAIDMMESGNRALHPEARKDLTLGKRDLLTGRRQPVHLHHWNRRELADFLSQEALPALSYLSHEAMRTAAIRNALLAGDFVPEDVMGEPEGKHALENALLHFRAGISIALSQQAHQDAQVAFEQALGYWGDSSDYEAALTNLLVEAVSRGRRVLVRRLGELPVPGLSVDDANIGACSSLTLTVMDSRLAILDGNLPQESVYSCLRRIDLGMVERLLAPLEADGTLSLAQCRRLMGDDWTPFPIVSDRCTSAA